MPGTSCCKARKTRPKTCKPLQCRYHFICPISYHAHIVHLVHLPPTSWNFGRMPCRVCIWTRDIVLHVKTVRRRVGVSSSLSRFEYHNLYHLMNNIYKSLEQYFPSLSTQKWKLSLTLHSWSPLACSTLRPTLPLLPVPSQSKDRTLPCALHNRVHSSLWIIHVL